MNAYLSARPASIGNGGIRFPNGMCFRVPTKYAAAASVRTGRHAGRGHFWTAEIVAIATVMQSSCSAFNNISPTALFSNKKTQLYRCFYRLTTPLTNPALTPPFSILLSDAPCSRQGRWHHLSPAHSETPASLWYALVSLLCSVASLNGR